MKKTLIAFAVFASFGASATGKPPTTPPSTPSNSAQAIAAAAAHAESRSSSLSSSRSSVNSRISNRTVVNVSTPAAAAPVVQNIAAPAAAPASVDVKVESAAEKSAPDLTNYAAQQRNPVSTAYAPNINPTSPCALTVSGGVQMKDFGVSFGGTPIADFCEKLEIARSAFNEGEADVAKEVKCGIPAYRAARLRLNKPCAEDAKRSVADASPQPATFTASVAPAKSNEPTDPFVRNRLGLRPL